MKTIILDRDGTMINPIMQYPIKRHPQIQEFLRALNSLGYITIMATNGSIDNLEEISKKAGLVGLLNGSFGKEHLEEYILGKHIQKKSFRVLERRIGYSLDQAVMIGNTEDVSTTPAKVPIIEVEFCEGSHTWDVTKAYGIINHLLGGSVTSADNFDSLYALGKKTKNNNQVLVELKCGNYLLSYWIDGKNSLGRKRVISLVD